MQFTFEELLLWDAMAVDGPTSNRVGPCQCPAQQCNNHHSGSHYHTGATPFSSLHCWTFSQYHCGHQPAAPGGLGETAVGFTHCLNSCLPAQYAKVELPSAALGLHHQGKRQRVPLNQMRRALPSQSQCQVLLGHPCGWLCQKMYPVLLTSATPYPCQLCQKSQRGLVPSASHSFRFPPGLVQLDCQRRCFSCRGKWTWPLSGCSWPGPLWTPVIGN